MAAGCVFVLAMGGCGDQLVEPMAEEVAPPPPPPVAVAPVTPVDALYDDEGNLLPSSDVVAGLALPRGLQIVLEDRRRHVYRSDVPMLHVQRYFGVRLVTGAVDALPTGGAVYRDAVPRDVQGTAVHLDVRVEPSSSAPTRVEVLELEPAPQVAPTERESLRRLDELLQRAD